MKIKNINKFLPKDIWSNCFCSYYVDEIWSVNDLHTQVTMEIKMSTLSENIFYASGNNCGVINHEFRIISSWNNLARFHAFYNKCTILLQHSSPLNGK